MAKIEKVKEIAAEVRKNRESVYGSPAILQTQLAAQFTSILRSYHQDDDFPEIPPRLVGLFLACLKMHRIAVPNKKKDRDSYVDLVNYVNFSEEVDDSLPPVISEFTQPATLAETLVPYGKIKKNSRRK